METVDPELVAAIAAALKEGNGLSWGELLSIALPSVVGIVGSAVYAVRETCRHLNTIAVRVDESLRHFADGTITVRVELVHREEVRLDAPPVRAPRSTANA